MFPIVRTVLGLVFGWFGARLLGLLARLHAGPNPEQKRATRRTFVRNAALGAVGVSLAELAAGMYFFVYPNKTGAFGQKLTVPKASVPAVGGTPFTDVPGKFYVVHTPDGVMALYWKCVHLGCTVPWVAGEHRFHCPCHGSIYQYDGQRVSGPAPRSLDYMDVSVTPAGDLQVNTGKINQRALYEPKQATPYKL